MFAHTLFTGYSCLSRLFLGGRGRFYGKMAMGLWTILYWVSPSPHFICDGGSAILRVCCTTLCRQFAPTHCCRSRGRKEFNFQSQKAGGVKAGPGHSNEVCKN